MSDTSETGQIRYSVVVEGYNEENSGMDGVFSVIETLEALKKQSVDLGQVEVIMLGSPGQVEQWKKTLGTDWPFGSMKFLDVEGAHYYQLKNRGSLAAQGEILAFADADAPPGPHWLSAISQAIEEGAECTVGPSLFRHKGGTGGETLFLKVVSSISWGFVVGKPRADGRPLAAGANGHNFAARREVFTRYLFREDYGRTLSPTLLFSKMIQDGVRIAFLPNQVAAHSFTPQWWLFRLHPRIGYEVYQFQRRDPRYPNRWVMWTGPLQPIIHMLLYMLMDIPRWMRFSRAIRMPFWQRIALLPVNSVMSTLARGAEMIGMMATMLAPRRMKQWAETS